MAKTKSTSTAAAAPITTIPVADNLDPEKLDIGIPEEKVEAMSVPEGNMPVCATEQSNNNVMNSGHIVNTYNPALRAAATRRLNAVPFANRDAFIVAVEAIRQLGATATVSLLFAEIERALTAEALLNPKTGFDVNDLLQNLEELGFVEVSIDAEKGMEIKLFDLTETGAALPTPDDSLPVNSAVLYVVERYLRSSRTMTAGSVMSIDDLISRVITTQQVPLSSRMTVYTPRRARNAVLKALAERFAPEELKIDAYTGTVTVLESLDPGRGLKNTDIWK